MQSKHNWKTLAGNDTENVQIVVPFCTQDISFFFQK